MVMVCVCSRRLTARPWTRGLQRPLFLSWAGFRGQLPTGPETWPRDVAQALGRVPAWPGSHILAQRLPAVTGAPEASETSAQSQHGVASVAVPLAKSDFSGMGKKYPSVLPHRGTVMWTGKEDQPGW